MKESPDEYYVEAIDSLYIEQEDAVAGIRTFKTEYIKYYYSEFDLEKAAKSLKKKREEITDRTVLKFIQTPLFGSKILIIPTTIQCTKIIFATKPMEIIQW